MTRHQTVLPRLEGRLRVLEWTTLALVLASLLTFAPLWLPLVLAAWFADILQPAVRALARRLGGRRRGAAAIIVLLVATAMIPVTVSVLAVTSVVRDLVARIHGALQGGSFTVDGVTDLVSRHGPSAWRALVTFTQASTAAMIGVVVFVGTLYALTVGGSASYRWLARNTPLPPHTLGRFVRAFRETGRGLIIGGGGTALAQGLAASVVYIVAGIPHALMLGALTALSALVPAVGTALVWAPLTIELVLAKDYVRAGVVLVVGLGVHSLIDNFVRPVLTRRGRVGLPTIVILVSMLGGAAAFGAAGVLLGPVIVRLTVEALAMGRERWM